MRFSIRTTCWLASAGWMATASPALAVNDTVSFSAATLDLGKVVGGSMPSTLSVNASTGTVNATLASDARGIGIPASVTTQIVTISCTTSCAGKTVTVVITANNSGRVSITSFNVGALSGNNSGSWINTPTPASSMTYRFNFTNGGNSKSVNFRIGYTVVVAASPNTTGLITFPFSVTASH